MRQHQTERIRGGAVTKAIRRLTHSTIMEAVGRFSGPVIAGLILLVLGKVWTMNDGFIALQKDLQELTRLVATSNADRYTGTQASNDKAFLQSQIDEIKKRQDRAETVRAAIRATSQPRPK